jgi:polyisoprenoid-binding protein YceI
VQHHTSHLLAGILLGAVLASAAAAQTTPVAIDADQSYAALWVGRETEVTPILNVGVAQVGGSMQLSAPDASTSALKFGLVPGGGGAVLLAPDGTLRTNEIAQLSRYTVMSFKSDQAHIRRDGHVEIAGLLTITHVTREVIAKPWTWGYSGVSYDDPVSNTVTRPVSFVVVNPGVEAILAHPKGVIDVLATATAEASDFPELVDDVLDSFWPIVALHEQCTPPPNAGDMRDYVGVLCDGKAITAKVPLNEHHSFAVDYHGMRETVTPTHGPVTIVLHLRLAAPPSSVSH